MVRRVRVSVPEIYALSVGSDAGFELEVWGVLSAQPYREVNPEEVVPDGPAVVLWRRRRDEHINIGEGEPYRNDTPPAQLELSDTQYLAVGGPLYEDDAPFGFDVLAYRGKALAPTALFTRTVDVRYREYDQIVLARFLVQVP